MILHRAPYLCILATIGLAHLPGPQVHVIGQNVPYVHYDFITGWLVVNPQNNQLVSLSVPGPPALTIHRWQNGTSSNGITDWVQRYADGKEQWIGTTHVANGEFVFPNNYTYDVARYEQFLGDNDFGEVEIGLLDQSQPNNVIRVTTRVAVYHADYTLVDFDLDGDADVNDANLLTTVGDLQAGLIPGSPGVPEYFDFDRDTIVDEHDLDEFLKNAAQFNGFSQPYYKGDADLNGRVDFADFVRLNNNWQRIATPDHKLGWGAGDFNTDGRVDFSDFVEQNNNWRRANTFSAALGHISVVPEPIGSSCLLFAVGMCATMWRQFHRVQTSTCVDVE